MMIMHLLCASFVISYFALYDEHYIKAMDLSPDEA